MKNLSDPELFARIQNHDQKAFAFLLDRYSKQIYELIYKRTRSDDDARDIMQDIFVSFWTNRQTIKIEQSAFPYFYRSAKYAIIDLMVKNQKEVAYQSILLKQGEPFSYDGEQIMIAGELKEKYQSEIAKMPSTMQQVYKMSRDENLSAKEIATKLRLSEQTVRNNISLALQRLRLSFGPDQLITILPFALFIATANSR